MIGKEYFARQAMTLLRMARVSNDPTVAASLVSKAAELTSRLDDGPRESDHQIGPTESALNNGKEAG